MANFFLNRPVFAFVISIIIVLVGLLCLQKLPVEQFPNITPVQILVTTRLSGASAKTMAESVASPLEQAINGVEDMIYMHSQSSSSGILTLIVSFKMGTDPNFALINTQNRVNLALSSLPIEVQRQGIAVYNKYSNVLLFAALNHQSERFDEIALTNFANTNVSEYLNRLDGVGSAEVLNSQDYSMRIWLKPDRLAQFKLSVQEVIASVREQNGIRPIGALGAEPIPQANELTIPVNAIGRFQEPEEFEDIILKSDENGGRVFLKDIGRVELGALDSYLVGHLNQKQGAFITIYQSSGANAINVSTSVKDGLEKISKFFPEGVSFSIPYDTTEYIKQSIWHVEKTLIEASIFVALIIFIFLHSLRASVIPVTAMVISICGTFICMYLLGFSINTLTLFGLVLCVGILVDDAIVIVENIERKIRDENLEPKEAAVRAMKELSAPTVATSCVLAAVFIPVSFIGGIPGQFFQQFAITIACSIMISAFVALTFSPSLSVLLINRQAKINRLKKWFDRCLEKITGIYVRGVRWVITRPVFVVLFCILVLGAIGTLATVIRIGFIPHEDQGLIMISASLPDGASLDRVERVSEKVEKIVLNHPAVEAILSFSGFSLIESIPRTEMGSYFVKLKDWSERDSTDQTAFKIIDQLNHEFASITEGTVTSFNPPDIPGVGVVGGFDFWVLNQGDIDYSELNKIIDQIAFKARQRPEFLEIITSLRADAMELFIDLDTAKARSLGVKIDDVYQTLQALLGSVYINQFNKHRHVYKVVAQAEPASRDTVEDIGDVYVKSDQGEMISLKSLITPRFSHGPSLYQRFNGDPAGLISVIPNISDPNRIISIMEEIADEVLPEQVAYSWGGLAYEQKQNGGISWFAIFGVFILMFLVLSALYERWALSFSILMSTPFAIFGGFLALWVTQSVANIYFQIGIITLIGLSAKNAILIVEFAKERRKEGLEIAEASLEASRLRFRAILMTSLTTAASALSLLITSGAGSASRKSVGTGIMGGMVIGTILAVFFVPVFYIAMEKLSERLKKRKE